MFYAINKEDGYIYGVVKGVSQENSNCTEEDYNLIKDMIENSPIAPEGFYYRLKENLEWEIYKIQIPLGIYKVDV
jgi:hypothetical protein